MTKEKAAAAAAEDKIPTSKNFTEELQALNEALASKKEEVDSLSAKVEALEAENVGLKEVIEELNESLKNKLFMFDKLIESEEKMINTTKQFIFSDSWHKQD